MAGLNVPITITEKSFIKKYAEDADPTRDEPFEIVQGPDIVYTGQQAIDRLIALGYTPEQFMKIQKGE